MTHPEIATRAKDDSRAADERLDAAYRDVQRYLDLTARRQLQAAQRAWLAFRDADCDFWGADDSALAGTNFSMAATKPVRLSLRGLRDSRIAAQAATDGLKLTRETTERQLRAYVCYKQARHEPPASGRHLTCFVEFQNCGATPAYDVLACGTSIAVELVEGFQYPPPPASAFEVGSQTTLGPTSSTTLCAVSD